jgi:hypothetical protein
MRDSEFYAAEFARVVAKAPAGPAPAPDPATVGTASEFAAVGRSEPRAAGGAAEARQAASADAYVPPAGLAGGQVSNVGTSGSAVSKPVQSGSSVLSGAAGAAEDAFGGAAASSFGSSAEKTLEAIVGPEVAVVRGLLSSVFGIGGGAPAAPTFTKYEQPAPIQFAAAESGSGFGAAEYDDMGMPRMVDSGSAGSGTGAAAPAGPAAPSSSSAGIAGGGAASPASPQVVMNISTMDARSFLDYSDQIAAAVSAALRTNHSVGDAIGDL